MKRIMINLSLVLCMGLSNSSAAQDAPLSDYVGFYELGQEHPVVISSRPGPGGRAILAYTDLKTNAFRALFPAGTDRFTFGPQLIAREPQVGVLEFVRTKAGDVIELALVEGKEPADYGARLAITTEEFDFERDGIAFEGTLFLPAGDGQSPGPAVVFAHGSEAEGQRGTFDALPWILASQGYVALAFDKRGTGASGGSWHVGLEVLAADGVSALAQLRRDPRVDPTRLGVIGFSEGGWLAPLIARQAGDLDFLIALSGGGMTKADTFVQKHARRFAEAGLSGEALEQALDEKRALVADSAERVLAGGGDGFDKRISYDPLEDWKRFDGSVLAIMGADDVLQDSAACAAWLRSALEQSKSADWQVHSFPKAHHGMFLASQGGTKEFQSMQVSGMVPGYWPMICKWLKEHR